MKSKELRLRRKRKTAFAVSWTSVGLLVICVAGLLVSFVLYGLARTNEHDRLYVSLIGGFAAGIAAFGLIGVGCMKLASKWLFEERDEAERAISEDSFFAGEGTVATFRDAGMVLEAGSVAVTVPYPELRAFAVCTRTRPREKGEWSVAIEIPAKYLSKKKTKNEPPVYAQFDYKPRLLDRLAFRGIAVGGEKKGKGKGRFRRLETFALPDRRKRRNALLTALVGAAVAAVGVGLAFTSLSTLSAVMVALGLLVAARSTVRFVQSKFLLAVYREGIFKREENGLGAFYKWEELVSVTRVAKDGEQSIRLDFGYGELLCPEADGFYDFVARNYPQKTEKRS